MKKNTFLLLIFLCTIAVSELFAQRSTGINNPNPSQKAALHIKNDGANKQGIIIPKLSGSDTSDLKAGLSNAEKGLVFYDSTNRLFQYWNGTRWLQFGGVSSSSSSWLTGGNALVQADTLTSFKYIGTNNDFPLIFATNGQQRMRLSKNGNLAIGKIPSGGIPLQVKSNSKGIVFQLEQQSNAQPLFDFRQNPNDNARFQMYNAAGTPTIELNAENGVGSYITSGNFGIGTQNPLSSLQIGTELHALDKTKSGFNGLSVNAISDGAGGFVYQENGVASFMILDQPYTGFFLFPAGLKNATLDDYTMNLKVTPNGVGIKCDGVNAFLDLRNGKDAINLPNGTTAQRPITPDSGAFRFNTITKLFEGFDGTSWITFGGNAPTSPWSVSGNNIYNSNTGSVGIGTSTAIAGYKLRVNGDGIIIDNNTTGIFFTSSSTIGNGYTQMLYDVSSGATGTPSMKYIFSPRNNANTGTTQLAELNFQKVAAQGVGFISFSTRNLANSYAERVRINSEGNVGIGTTSPLAKLTIAEGNILIARSDGGSPKLSLSGDGQGITYDIFMDDAGDGNLHLEYSSGSLPRGLAVGQSNKIGIGIANPLMTLHTQIPLAQEAATSGTTTKGNLRLDAANSPLALDLGVADDAYSGGWLQSHSKTNQTLNYPLLLNPNGGNVGIGVTDPVASLHVAGNIAFSPKTASRLGLTTGFSIDPSSTYIRMTTTVAISSSSTTAILDGDTPGQILILHNNSTTGLIPNITIRDNANTKLAGGLNFTMGIDDTLTLIWDGAVWLEISRSDN